MRHGQPVGACTIKLKQIKGWIGPVQYKIDPCEIIGRPDDATVCIWRTGLPMRAPNTPNTWCGWSTMQIACRTWVAIGTCALIYSAHDERVEAKKNFETKT